MKLKRIATWALAVVLALEFCLAGAAKFPASSGWIRMFAAWGYPSWARQAIGAIEVLCGIALLVPRARRPACAALLAVMAGAAVTHLTHGEPRRIVFNILLAALLVALVRIDA
jgi:putative oxidoreductase